MLEQVGDALPREKKLSSPDAILRAVDKAMEERIAERAPTGEKASRRR